MAYTYSGGSGTSGDPYLISTPDDLNEVRYNLSSHFKQTNDIDMNVSPYNIGNGFDPIGTSLSAGNYFSGSYDGDYYKIKNLYINRPSVDNVALFASLNGNAVVKKIVLTDVDVTGGNLTAAICGEQSSSDIYIINIISGSVSGEDNVGAIVGRQNLSYMTDDHPDVYMCQSDANVTGANYVGGLVGNCYQIRIARCNGTVSGSNYVGGIIGCLSEGADYIGKLISYSNVTGTGYQIGGVVGEAVNVISDSVSYGNVEGLDYVGGFVGAVIGDIGTFENCFSTGTVTGRDFIGGFCALEYFPDSIASNCYYDSTVTGLSDTGKGEPKTTAQLKTTDIGSGIFGSYYTFLWKEGDTSQYPFLYVRWTYVAGSNGTIDGESSKSYDVELGEDVPEVEVIPNTGYEFEEWEDLTGEISTDNPRQDKRVLTSNTVTASFAIIVLTLSYTPGANAILTGTSPQSVDYGDNGTEVSITPDPGYVFQRWSDGNTDNPRQDTSVTDDVIVYAIVTTIENYDDVIDIVLNPNLSIPDTFSIQFFPTLLSQYKSSFYNKFLKKAVMFNTMFGTPYTENNNFVEDNFVALNGIVNDGKSIDYRIYDTYDTSGASATLDKNFYSINRIDFSRVVFSNVGNETYLTYANTPFNKQMVLASKKILDDGTNKKLRYMKFNGAFNKATFYISANYPDDEFYNGLDSLTYDRLNSMVSDGVFTKITVNRSDFEEMDPIVIGDKTCDVLLDINQRLRFKPIIGKWFHVLVIFDFTPDATYTGIVSNHGEVIRDMIIGYEILGFRSKRY
jgi:hypothetical protein